MQGDFIKINKWLLPLSCLYGLGVTVRNKLFDWKILPSCNFAMPVINIGNITVGGTGKTPHTEYLIRLLQKDFQVAVLSRGYKRESQGFVWAQTDTSVAEIGDEPYQMKQKFPHVHVAVDEDRPHGIHRLIDDSQTADTEVILLDDAYQHRYITAGMNILLIDFHRPIYSDKLLPAGRLREPASGKKRADIVIFTKCPRDMKSADFDSLAKAVNLSPRQQLYFTTLQYGYLLPLYNKNQPIALNELGDFDSILLVTGIASPQQILLDLQSYNKHFKCLSYGDHHSFTAEDIKHIREAFRQMPGKKNLIVTTEKDAVRLNDLPFLDEELKNCIYRLPIEVKFLRNQEDLFNQTIINYVRKNSRNSILAQS